MSRVLVIGCGGVANVAIRKCCQVDDIFTEICIASRTKYKCDELAAELKDQTSTKITTAQVNADNVEELIALINSYKPDLVMNIALPYESVGIIPSVTRRSNGIRNYCEKDLAWVELAAKMNRMELSIDIMHQCVNYCIDNGLQPHLPNHILQRHKEYLIMKRELIDETIDRLNEEIVVKD